MLGRPVIPPEAGGVWFRVVKPARLRPGRREQRHLTAGLAVKTLCGKSVRAWALVTEGMAPPEDVGAPDVCPICRLALRQHWPPRQLERQRRLMEEEAARHYGYVRGTPGRRRRGTPSGAGAVRAGGAAEREWLAPRWWQARQG